MSVNQVAKVIQGVDAPIGAVVVGCDGSWQSLHAVESAAQEAVRRDTGLVLLSVVVETEVLGRDMAQWASREGEALAQARAFVARAADRARAAEPGVEIHSMTCLLGSPELVDLAARAGALVLGGHGRRGPKALSLGSTSAELAQTFAVPLLLPAEAEVSHLARPVLERRPAVVVGLDGGPADTAVLAAAAEQAGLRACGVVAVRALRASESVDDDVIDEVRLRTHAEVTRVAAAQGVPSYVVAVAADPVRALVDHCEPHDLLVVGTKGQGRLAGLVSGSVARGVLDAVPCDVLVVRAEAG